MYIHVGSYTPSVLFLLIRTSFHPYPASKPVTYDSVVYGGTPAGIVAAIQAFRTGRKVILIEPGMRIGGAMTVGLSFHISDMKKLWVACHLNFLKTSTRITSMNQRGGPKRLLGVDYAAIQNNC